MDVCFSRISVSALQNNVVLGNENLTLSSVPASVTFSLFFNIQNTLVPPTRLTSNTLSVASGIKRLSFTMQAIARSQCDIV